jgi:hypothetical protein
MSLKRSDLVKATAEKVATDLFLTMLNPQSRSAKFRFSSFAIESWAQRQLSVNLPSAPTPKELEIAGTAARQTWERLTLQVGDAIPRRFR